MERGLALCGEPADPPHPFPRGGQDPPRESRCRTVPTYPPEASPGLASARRSLCPQGTGGNSVCSLGTFQLGIPGLGCAGRRGY